MTKDDAERQFAEGLIKEMVAQAPVTRSDDPVEYLRLEAEMSLAMEVADTVDPGVDITDAANIIAAIIDGEEQKS